ncbi:MAG: tetratricopeptide repeat protein [Bacteroidota bacterium]
MRFFIPILILLVGCQSQVEKQEITGLDSASNVYLDAYEEVERAYDNEPSTQLLNQKLYYLEKLGWPPMSITALNEAKQQLGLDEELVRKYILYYEKNEQYAPLMELLGTWGKLHDLDEGMQESNIRAHMLLSQREKTVELLKDYIYEYGKSDNEAFVANKYLKLGDTLMSIYHFSRLQKKDPGHEDLVNQYVPLLLKIRQPARARVILTKAAQIDTTFQTRFMLSKSLYQMGETKSAKGLLIRQNNAKALEQLTRWYWQEERWDSTMFYVDKLIQVDSSQQALFMKASIYDERGVLNPALQILNILIERDSTDNLAMEMAQDVSRKIAYLREIKERRSTPIPELSPKTSIKE